MGIFFTGQSLHSRRTRAARPKLVQSVHWLRAAGSRACFAFHPLRLALVTVLLRWEVCEQRVHRMNEWRTGRAASCWAKACAVVVSESGKSPARQVCKSQTLQSCQLESTLRARFCQGSLTADCEEAVFFGLQLSGSAVFQLSHAGA